MVIDSSALPAILFGESEAPIFAKPIGDSGIRIASSVTAFEAGVVMRSHRVRPGGAARGCGQGYERADVVPVVIE